MSENKGTQRRDFLKTMLAVGVAPMVLPASTLGRAGAVAPNSRIGLGFISCGDRQRQLYNEVKMFPVAQIIAGSDVDAARRWEFAQKNGLGTPTYNDYRELLERRDIDAVIISTTDQWHAPAVIDSAQARKDIYCEKPLTLTIDEGKLCVEAVRNNKVVFQTGSQQRSECNGYFRKAVELARNGYIGEIKLIETFIGRGPSGGMDPDVDPNPGLDWDRWLGQAPWVPYRKTRCHYEYRWWYAYSGGKLTDWGAHHNDIAQWILDCDNSGPISAEGTATFPEPGGYDTALTFEITFEYKDKPNVICRSDGPNGVKITGSEGEIFVSRGSLETKPAELATIPYKPTDKRLYYEEDGHKNHMENWLNCIETRKDPICPVEVGHRSVTVCHLANIAIRLGRKINWDPEKEMIVGDEEAAAWQTRPQRAGYELPKVKGRSMRPITNRRRG